MSYVLNLHLHAKERHSIATMQRCFELKVECANACMRCFGLESNVLIECANACMQYEIKTIRRDRRWQQDAQRDQHMNMLNAFDVMDGR